MSKKHSPSKRKGIPLGRAGGKLHRLATQEELLAIKVGRNAPCPCGKVNQVTYVFDDGAKKDVDIPVKYKKCCMNKKLFYTKENAKLVGLNKQLNK